MGSYQQLTQIRITLDAPPRQLHEVALPLHSAERGVRLDAFIETS